MKALLTATHEIITPEIARQIVEAVVKRAIHGDIRCVQLLFNYLEGTPTPMEREEDTTARPINVHITYTSEEIAV
jgi:hypothetical protein